jgi:hypothetical protein
LASLAPRLPLLLPAHNTPVAEPDYLPRVVQAMEQVRGGKVKGTPKNCKKECTVEAFSFLMAK